MIPVICNITIDGVEVKLLFTPRLFLMAEAEGLKFEIDVTNPNATVSAYADMTYCAALNAWTLEHGIEPFPYKRIDFHVWAQSDLKAFGNVMAFASRALTGKTVKELVQEQQGEAGEDVKKKSKSKSIMTRLRRFWSAIVG